MTVSVAETRRYALLLDTYIKDKQERYHLFNAYNDIPCVKQKGRSVGRGPAVEFRT